MIIVPINLKAANDFVTLHHRHNKKVTGCKFCIAAMFNDKIIGVAICGRPVSRHLDDGFTLEVNRVCTDGTKNATSFLYSKCKKVAMLLGYKKVITYTLQKESGSSLKAIGAIIDKNTEHVKQWNSTDKVKRNNQSVTVKPKFRWQLINNPINNL